MPELLEVDVTTFSFVHGQYGNPIYDLADSIGLVSLVRTIIANNILNSHLSFFPQDLNYNERESGWKVVGEDGDWKKEAGDAIISDVSEWRMTATVCQL